LTKALVAAKTLAKMSDQTFSERLAWLREVSGLGSREVGRLAELSESYASVIERSDANRPGYTTLRNLAKLFGVTCEWLATGDGPLPSVSAIQKTAALARAAAEVPSPPPDADAAEVAS
jgi:transcriptional regulator with XRE-family HTH domain